MSKKPIDEERKSASNRVLKTAADIIVILCVILFYCSSVSVNEEHPGSFYQFFHTNGADIAFIVCVIWVWGGLFLFLSTNRPGSRALTCAMFFMGFSIFYKLYNIKEIMQSPEELAELSASIILFASVAGAFFRESSNK